MNSESGNVSILKDKSILVFQKSGFIGGAERNLEQWAFYFQEKYNMKISLCGPGEGPFFSLMSEKGIFCHKISLPDWRKGKNFVRRYMTQNEIQETLSHVNCDIVFSNDFFYAPYAVHLGKKKNIPSIIHIQSDCEEKRIRQYHLDKATSVITTTQSSYERLQTSLTKTDFFLIPCGVKDPHSSSHDRSPGQFRVKASKISFGIAANLLPHKGLDMFFDLILEIRDIPDWEIHWVGGDPQGRLESLKEKVRTLGLSDRVFFHGFLDKMEEFYQSIDCLVHLADFEPFGIVLIEAMSHHCPVISTRTNGGVEILGDVEEGRWTTQIRDPKGMANLMKEIIARKESIPLLGEKFYEKFKTTYDNKKMLRKLEEVFCKMLMKQVSNSLSL